MFTTTNALVLREVRYKEADRILTLLTSTEGKISVKARGALRKGSRMAALPGSCLTGRFSRPYCASFHLISCYWPHHTTRRGVWQGPFTV